MFLQLQIFIYLGEIVDEKEGEKRNKSSVFVYFGIRDIYGKPVW